MRVIHEGFDDYGNEIVVWSNEFGDMYETTYYVEGGSYTEFLGEEDD